MERETPQPETPDHSPVQPTLAGLDPTEGLDPRFILDDDTCRRGLRHVRALRARLEAGVSHPPTARAV